MIEAPVKGNAPDSPRLAAMLPDPSAALGTEPGRRWRTRPARRGAGRTRWVVVGADCTLAGAVVGVGRVVEVMVVGVGRVVDGVLVGVVGAGAATAAPVPNRSVTQ